jgi:hypothetical protein
MSKRKVFIKSSHIFHQTDTTPDNIDIPPLTPTQTIVYFGYNATNYRSFNFKPWYGVRIDAITSACQQQIERFLKGLDCIVEVSSITSYCRGGLRHFLDFMVQTASLKNHDLTLNDIDRFTIDDYLNYLQRPKLTTNSQKNLYSQTKSVLNALGQRGLLQLIKFGDYTTFPRNPFPHSNQKLAGESSLPKAQRQEFSAALKQAVMPIWQDGVKVTSTLLSYVLLIVALHTGRNTTPLLEMERDCLRAHPKNNMKFLVLWKRRGHNTSKIALRSESPFERVQESNPTIRTNIELLIQRAITLTEPLVESAPLALKSRVWLHYTQVGPSAGHVVSMSNGTLERSIKILVKQYQLKDANGASLRVNISRLRKTFANRIFELLDGDLVKTAIALGNTPQVASRNYLAPGEHSRRNWNFMGEILVQELTTCTIGSTYKPTPVGRCNHLKNGQYAPKKEGAVCFSFLNCIRCKHYAVTSDDLYKLFSFYFRIYAERSRMDKRRWSRDYAHIPRLIEHEIVAEGIRKGIFSSATVEAARQRARDEPDPFWTSDVVSMLETLS